MNTRTALAAVCAGILIAMMARLGANSASDPLVERGRYLVAFGSCNDCHTPGWRESDGRVPVSKWMVGSTIGRRGPWGTAYPANARLWFSQTREADWLFSVNTRGGHPPMVWHDLRFLTRNDQRAIYRFIRSLGSAGKPAPAPLGPGIEPKTPYVWIVPHADGHNDSPH